MYYNAGDKKLFVPGTAVGQLCVGSNFDLPDTNVPREETIAKHLCRERRNWMI
jgi:hypothetical protein